MRPVLGTHSPTVCTTSLFDLWLDVLAVEGGVQEPPLWGNITGPSG